MVSCTLVLISFVKFKIFFNVMDSNIYSGALQKFEEYKNTSKHRRDTDSGFSSNSDISDVNKSASDINKPYGSNNSPIVILRKSRFMEKLIGSIKIDVDIEKRYRRRQKQRFNRKSGRSFRSLMYSESERATKRDPEQIVQTRRKVKALTESVNKGGTEQIVRMFKIQISNVGKTLWKRPDDVPTNINRITSHDNIFGGAILGEYVGLAISGDDKKPHLCTFADFDESTYKALRNVKAEVTSSCSNSPTKSDTFESYESNFKGVKLRRCASTKSVKSEVTSIRSNSPKKPDLGESYDNGRDFKHVKLRQCAPGRGVTMEVTSNLSNSPTKSETFGLDRGESYDDGRNFEHGKLRRSTSGMGVKTEVTSDCSNSSTKSDSFESDTGKLDNGRSFKPVKLGQCASGGTLPKYRKKITFNNLRQERMLNETPLNFLDQRKTVNVVNNLAQGHMLNETPTDFLEQRKAINVVNNLTQGRMLNETPSDFLEQRKPPKVVKRLRLKNNAMGRQFSTFEPFGFSKETTDSTAEFVTFNNGTDTSATNTYVSQKTFDEEADDGNFAKPKIDLREVLTIKRKHIFKAPMLPLCKRPPTRIASTQIVNMDERHRPQPPSVDNDAISLYAESLSDALRTSDTISKVGDVPKMEILSDVEDELLRETTAEETVSVLPQDTPDVLDDRLEETTPESVPEETFESEIGQEHVKEWIESSSSSTPLWSTADKTISRYVRRFCNCYFRSSCHRKVCRFLHTIPDEFKLSFDEITLDQFTNTYNYACTAPKLFKEMYPYFVTYLKNKEKTEMLINLLNDIFECPIYDKTPFVKLIVSALQDLGYTFASAIEEILLINGTQNACLLDILLMLFVEEDDCLENNWSMIPKLAEFIRNKIDIGVINVILKKCVRNVPPNQQFCVNVYQDLVLKNYVDLHLIERKLIVQYVNLMYTFHLPTFAENIMKLGDITMSELVTTPPPPLPTPNLQQPPKAHVFISSGSDGTTSSTEQEISDSSSYKIKRNTSESTKSKGDDFEYQKETFNETHRKANESTQSESIWNNTTKPCYKSTLNSNENTPYPFDLDKRSPCRTDVTFKFDNFDHYYHNRYDDNYFVGSEETRMKSCSPEIAPLNIKRSLSMTNSSKDDVGCLQSSQFHNQSLKNCKYSPKIVENSPDVILTDMNNNDIIKLSDAIKSDSVTDFLTVLRKYEASGCSKSFVIHAVTMLSNENVTTSVLACGFIQRIFSSFDFEPNPKSTLSQFAFNILPFLDKNRKYAEAFTILNKFSTDLPKLVEIELIHKSNEYLSTIDLKYAFVFKLFTRGGKLREALKLLKSPEMNLFEKYFSASDTVSILNYKKRIMKEFVSECLKTNIIIAKELVYFLMLNSNNNDNIDVIWILNELIIKMINKYGEYKSELIVLLENILNGWYKHLNKNVLRALLIQLYVDLPDRKILDIFHLCASVGIYQGFDGLQNCIKLSSSFLKEEIYLILHGYFCNIGKSNCPIEKIYISVDVPMSDFYEPTSLINIFVNTSSKNEDMKIRILNVLCKLHIAPDSMIIGDKYIVVPYSSIKSILSQYKGGNSPPLCRFT